LARTHGRAVNSRSTDAVRLEHATNALKADGVLIRNSMETYESKLEQLDATVTTLVEAANGVHNEEYRLDATKIAAQARNVYSEFVSIKDQRALY
jgi:hypothetical protein